jgi:succinyl-diaminopimelate desuccinylase
MGVNAVHRLGTLLSVVAGFDERSPVLDGCTYREALQAVRVEGGVAGNVVPDRATVELNHRFAPDRTAAEAEASVRSLLAPVVGDGDVVSLTDAAEGAPPGLDHPLLRSLVASSGVPVRAKLGWTDVARFAAAGIPACNFGPGDPTLAHHPDEHVTRTEIESVHATLSALLRGEGEGVAGPGDHAG